MPHGPLHVVPWRALGHDLGLPWERLAYANVFSLLPLAFPRPSADLMNGDVVGLGFDNRGHPVFREEPLQFVQLFGQRGHFQEPCSEQNVRAALSGANILDLSCHGRGQNVDADVELILRLEDPTSGYRDVPLLQFCPAAVTPQLVIMSACYSGVYNMAGGDYPVGGAPLLLQRGVQYCLIMRFAARANFARDFVVEFGRRLAAGATIESAFARANYTLTAQGADLWRDMACAELLAAR